MIDMYSKMALDYGIYATIAAAEFVKLDMMGSALLYMESRKPKPAITETPQVIQNSGRGREGERPNDNRWLRHTNEAKNSTA